MTYAVTPITSDIAEAILVWGGCDSPTPDEVAAARLAAQSAQDTIVFYRKVDEFEDEYRSLAIEMGAYMYNKRGVDGVLAYSEAGVQRSFEDGSFPRSMLSRIRLPVTTG